MTIVNETLGKLIKDITSLCDSHTYDESVERYKSIKGTIYELSNATFYEKGQEEAEILAQKRAYDKINFQKIERIEKSGATALIVGVCIVELVCLLLAKIGVNSNLCTVMSIISVVLFGITYTGLALWGVAKLAVRDKYNSLQDSLEETTTTAEILKNLEGMLDYIYKHTVNKPEALTKESKQKKPRSKKS